MNCQTCQPLLLDHLYGLLDGPDEAAVSAHLASCPACAAAQAGAARVQGLIARAAKSAFPDTRFEAPVAPAPLATAGATTPAPASPATLPFPAPKADTGARPARTFRIGTVLPWAVAAAVLCAIPGTVIPVLGMFNRAAEADRAADTARRDAELAANNVEFVKAGVQSRLSDAEFKVAVAEQSQTLLLSQWDESLKNAVRSATARRLTVDVKKPATVQPGAPNDFVVVVNDQRDQWERSGKRMVAEVHAVNASDAVIFTQALDSERTADKKHALRLPAGAWTKVQPDAELFLVVAQVDEKTQTRTELLERVRLAGPVFATLMVTDKAAYRPGERLFFRSLTLDRVTFRPPGREQILRYELLHPDGRPVGGLSASGTTDLVRVGAEGKVEPVRSADGQPVRGVGCGEFVLPPDLADGDYTLVLREHHHPGGFPATVPTPVTRPVKVRSGAPEDFRKQLGFARGSFAPGETVEAWAELAFQDKPVPNATVLGVTAQVDGRVIDGIVSAKTTNANGRADFRFALPEEVLNGDVRVKVTFRTPLGTEEVVARHVPVVGSRLVVEFFPECGDALVAGVPCKVYVRATTPAGVPVDIRGTVTDGRQTLAKVETLTDKNEPGANRGLAAFTYTPELGTRVWLKLDSPTGAYAPILAEARVPNAPVGLLGGAAAAATRTGYPLPLPKLDGVVMTVLDPVTAPGEPIRVRIHSVGQPRSLVVGAYTRGRLSDTQKVTVDPEMPQTVKLMTGADPRGGVVRVTVFEEVDAKEKGKGGEPQTELKPVAERLVFRKPGEKLNVVCTAAPADAPGAVVPVAPLAPGFAAPALPANSAVTLSLTATDEKGRAAAAILWAAAVNTGAAPGPKDRLMPTHFLLAGEVKKPDDLEYADFLLTDHPKAAEALDLLLGTQGWRRFAEQQAAPPDEVRVKPAGAPNQELVRLGAQNGQYPVETEPALVREHRKLVETFGPRYEAAVKAVARAKAALDATRKDAQNPQPVLAASALADEAKRTAEQTTVRAESAREPVRLFRANVWFGVAGLAALALCCGAVAVARPTGRFPLGFSTLGSLGLAVFLVLAAGWGDDAKATAQDGPGAQKAELAKSDAQRDDEGLARGGVAPTGPTPAMPPTLETAKFDAGWGKGGRKGDAMPQPGPAKGALGGGFGAATNAKPEPPKTAFGPPPGPPGAGRPPEPKVALGGGGPGGAGFVPPPGPIGPPAPISLPGMAPAGASGGWEKHNPNGVSLSDLATGHQLALAPFGATDRTAERANELKKAADRAAAYANDRANHLGAAMDAYFQHRMRMKKGPPEPAAPVAPEKSHDVERFVVRQIRGSVAPVTPLVVREYAAPRPTAPGFADDTPDTVLWQPVIVLPADGKATLNFHLGAAPGGYQLMVAGHTADGRLGAVRGLILTSPPKTLAPPQFGPVGPGAPGGSVSPVIPVAPAPQRMP